MSWTKDQINRMPGAEYKKNFETDPEFRKFVDEMDAQPNNRPAVSAGTATARDRAQTAVRQAEDPASFDPAFDDQPPAVVAPVAVIPVVEVPAVSVPVAEMPEKIHEYQPTDEAGRPIGGQQRFKYRTEAELIEKLTKAHIEATKALRSARAKVLVSGTDVVEGATRFPSMTEFAVLSSEETKALQEDLQDPAKADAARARLADSARNESLNRLQEDNFAVRAQLALSEFKSDNPDFYRCKENAEALIGYVTSRNLDPTEKQNLQTAYDALREFGGLVGRPINQSAAPALATETPSVREVKTVPNSQAPVEAAARIGVEVPSQEKRTVTPIPTGLSNRDVSTEGEPSESSIEDQLVYKKVYKDGTGRPTGVVETFKGIEALDNMPASEYERLIKQDEMKERTTGKGTGFRQTVDSLEELRTKRRNEARGRRR